MSSFRLFKTLVLRSGKHEFRDNGNSFISFVEHKKTLEQILRKYFEGTIQKEVELSGGRIFKDIDSVVTLSDLIKKQDGFIVTHINADELPELIERSEILPALRANDLLGFVLVFNKVALERIDKEVFSEALSLFARYDFKLFHRYYIDEDEAVNESEHIKRYLSYFNDPLFTEIQFERPEVYNHPELSDLTMPNIGRDFPHPCREHLHLILKANGDVYPCSVGILSPQLNIGNWIKEDMDAIIKRFENNMKITGLIENGPISLINADNENLAGNALNRPYMDSCHSCRRLFTEVLDNKKLVDTYEK